MTAVMAYMLADWYRPNVKLDYPKGGTGAVIDALVRGVTKTGGKVITSAHVDQILVEGNRAVGVCLKSGKVLRARKGVVSNASIWNTARLLPPDALRKCRQEMESIPQTESFLHLHVGIDAKDLPADLQCHYAVVNDFKQPINSPGNVIIISIPSLLDPSLAPAGSHTIHGTSRRREGGREAGRKQPSFIPLLPYTHICIYTPYRHHSFNKKKTLLPPKAYGGDKSKARG